MGHQIELAFVHQTAWILFDRQKDPYLMSNKRTQVQNDNVKRLNNNTAAVTNSKLLID